MSAAILPHEGRKWRLHDLFHGDKTEEMIEILAMEGT
jgi:hypothetical protein